MSQPLDNEKVTKNNERLFSIYENHLKSSNFKDYTETAAKLTVWLGKSKAYYADARPMIVRLLTIAQMTLRGAVGCPLDVSVPFIPARWLNHPLTPSYVVLVQATRPFADLFVEPPLKNAITHLLQGVEGIPLSHVSPPTTRQQASPPLPAPDSRIDHYLKEMSTSEQKPRPVSLQGSQIIQVHSANSEVAPTPQVSGQPSIESRPSTAEQGLPTSPSASNLPNTAKAQRNQSPEITFIGKSQKPTVGSSGAALSTSIQGNQSSIGVSRQGLRTKKSKKFDLSAFVQSDIQDFKQRQAQAKREVSDSVPIKKEPETEEISLKAIRQSTNAEGIESITPKILSSPVAQTQHSPTQNQSLQEHSQPLEQPHSELVKQPASHSLGHFESSSQYTASHTLGQQRPAHTSPISNIQSMMGSSVPLGKAQITVTDIPAPPTPFLPHTTDPQLATSPSSTSTIADHPLDSMMVTPTAKKPTEGPHAASTAPEANMDIPQSAASVEIQTTPPRIQLRPLLISEDSNLARFFKLYDRLTSPKHHLIVDGNTEPEEGGEGRRKMHLADDMAALLLAKETPKKRFQVVAFTRGGTQDSFTEIAFNLTQSDMDYLSIWLDRKASQLKDTASSYCLSLGCYSSHELMKRLGQQLDATIEVRLTEAIASMQSAWPQIGGLSINVHFDGSRKDLPLAPPLVTTVDGHVDLSEFALLGRNSITIHQEEKDVSDYTFVLHAHNPTLGQLQEIVRQRKSEVEWRDWLVDVTRPLHIDVPPLSPTHF